MGDWNVAPLDSDVGDPALVQGFSTHISPPERAAFADFEAAGLTDVVRPLVPVGFTYWDYKQLRFPRNEGLRIDFILGSKAFADQVTSASIHRNERKGTAPSDHVPVMVELAVESDEDDDDRPDDLRLTCRRRCCSRCRRPSRRRVTPSAASGASRSRGRRSGPGSWSRPA